MWDVDDHTKVSRLVRQTIVDPKVAREVEGGQKAPVVNPCADNRGNAFVMPYVMLLTTSTVCQALVHGCVNSISSGCRTYTGGNSETPVAFLYTDSAAVCGSSAGAANKVLLHEPPIFPSQLFFPSSCSRAAVHATKFSLARRFFMCTCTPLCVSPCRDLCRSPSTDCAAAGRGSAGSGGERRQEPVTPHAQLRPRAGRCGYLAQNQRVRLLSMCIINGSASGGKSGTSLQRDTSMKTTRSSSPCACTRCWCLSAPLAFAPNCLTRCCALVYVPRRKRRWYMHLWHGIVLWTVPV